MYFQVLWLSRKIKLDRVERVMTPRCEHVCVDVAHFMQMVTRGKTDAY